MKELRYISLCCIMLSYSTFAQEAAWDRNVSVNFNQISLKQALSNLSTQYGLRFSYSDSNIPVDRIIDVEFTNMRLRELLSQLLQQNGIHFSIIENQIVLFPADSKQSIKIRGKVVQTSGKPVPFANIALSGTTKGTSTNLDGEFELVVSKLPSELLISHLNHEKKLIHVYDEASKLEIVLPQAPRQLQEVTIRGRKSKNALYNQLRKAYRRLSSLNGDTKYGKAFYRQTTSREGEFTEIFELFYDIRYSENGIEDWAVQEGRYAFQQQNEYDVFLYNKNFTLLSRMFPISQPATDSYLIPVNADVKEHFNIDLKEVLNYNNRMIGVFSFSPKAIGDIPIAMGELYIDFETLQILKMKGTLIDQDLDIIGLTDDDSNWKNYQLDFHISFIDDPADDLILDFVQIDHQFDYFYLNKFVGHIQTSSLLTFYEHYTPTKNKRLGGSINFDVSDMEVIDAVGYDADFWASNPIVKRTPLEEELIDDFEENEAFGVVFLNNDDEVVLLEEKHTSEKAQKMISDFETQNSGKGDHLIYMQQDKFQYYPGESVQFTAHIIDKLTHRPYLLGSVLKLELLDQNGSLIEQEDYDIKRGSAYGELHLAEHIKPGQYVMRASTNIQGECTSQVISVSGFGTALNASKSYRAKDSISEIELNIFPEGGKALKGLRSSVVLHVSAPLGDALEEEWHITDALGQSIATTATNRVGIGKVDLTQFPDKRYFINSTTNGHEKSWKIPAALDTGMTIRIHQDKSRSVRILIQQKPAIPKTVHLLFSANGKVVRYLEKKLGGSQTIVELPRQQLPAGIISLHLVDENGDEYCKRSIFLPPEELSIQLESVKWKSKRSDRVQLQFRISDQENHPVGARLSAICTWDKNQLLEGHDIRTHVYFDGYKTLQKVNTDFASDSILSLIDALLIVSDASPQVKALSAKASTNQQTADSIAPVTKLDEPVFAEVSVTGNYTPDKQMIKNAKTANNSRNQEQFETYWIPQLEINELGIASLSYKVPRKNKSFYVQIQGIAQNGMLGYALFEVDPLEIRK